MASLLNKISGTSDTRPAEIRQAAVNHDPHHENLQQDTLRQEPRYQENVYDNNIGRTDHGRNAMGQESLRRGDVPVQNNIPHQGHGTTRTGHSENVYEDRTGYSNQARNALGQASMRRHDGPIESNMPYENTAGETPYVRTSMGQHNLERHDAPVHRTIAHQDGHTTKTGPVHNSEMLNKLDPRVHEHKDRIAANDHSLTGTRNEQVPLDAARVPPSVMQQHMGPPSIEHDFPEDSKHKRHSVSHQEAHLLR